LLPEVVVVRILETITVGLWHTFGAVTVAKIVPFWASAADGAISVAWAVSGAFLDVFVVAFVLARAGCASSKALSSLVCAVVLTSFCFVSPNSEALVFVGDSAAPARARAAKRTLRVARAVSDADVFVESAVALALTVAGCARDRAVVGIISAGIPALLGDVTVVLEAVLVCVGEVGAVSISENVVWWAAATVGAVRMAWALGRVIDVLLIALVLAGAGAARRKARVELCKLVLFAVLGFLSPNSFTLIFKARKAFWCLGVIAARIARTTVDAFDDLFTAENFAVGIAGAGIDTNIAGCCARVSADLGRFTMLLEALEVWIRKSVGAIAVTKLVLGWAVASVGALFVAWALLQIFRVLLGAIVLAKRRIGIAHAVSVADGKRVFLVSLASRSFVAPDGFALDFNWWRSRLAPVAARASVRAAGIAWACVDANSLLVLAFSKAFAVAIAFGNANICIVTAAIAALL